MIAPLPRRLLTLALAALPWLPAAHAQAPAAAPVSAAAASAGASRLTVQNDTLWNIAVALVPGREPSRAQVMVAILRANPQAFVGGNIHRLRKDVVLLVPSLEAMRAEPAARAAALVDAHLAAAGEGRVVMALPPLPSQPDSAVPAAPPPPAPVTPPAPAPAPARAPVAVPAPQPVPQPEPPAPPPAPVAVVKPTQPAPVASAPVAASAPRPAASSIPRAASADPGGAASAPIVQLPQSPAETGPTRWFPYLMLVALVSVAVVLWMRRRPTRSDDNLPSTFVDEQGVQRRRRPKVLDVSQAAADMTRTVETLQSAATLVSAGTAVPAAAVPVAPDLRQQAALKLDLARACMEIGRSEAARSLLAAVAQEGSADQQADAAELAARLN